MSLEVKRYAKERASEWDAFVERARNGLFLFRRSYMDYHADRFTDHSLVIEEDGVIRALFPANASDGTLVSHAGLTFGGLLVEAGTHTAEMVELVAAMAAGAGDFGFRTIVYKQVPDVFQRPRTGDETYALFRRSARILKIEPNFVVDRRNPEAMQERRLRSIKKAKKAGCVTEESDDFRMFWRDVLVPVLESRHSTKPVHTEAEIELLRDRHPGKLRLHVARLDGKMVAGTVLYDYGQVLHTQYLASNERGRTVGALDLVIDAVMAGCSAPYLSFGIASEQGGQVLNTGLAEWKESFGARCVPHQVWSLDTRGTS